METPTVEVVLLRGSSILHADSLTEIATLDEDGQWRAPDGAVVDAIGVPCAAARPITKPGSDRAHHQQGDQAWLNDALIVLEGIARRQPNLTVDDCRQHAKEPRKPYLMSTLMIKARDCGLIEMTDEHRRSTRPNNGGRTVRVWRSLVHPSSSPSDER